MSVYSITFSPTGGTQRVAQMLEEPWLDQIVSVDLTDRNRDLSQISLTGEDVVFFAVPSYGGRVPAPALEKIKQIPGNGARAVLICVYGNRAYEGTLKELDQTLRQGGFQSVAGVAAVAEHSIAHQFATGRPDALDHKNLQDFGKQILEKLRSGSRKAPQLPGELPTKPAGGAIMVPKAGKNCVSCGICAQKCPVGAIDLHDPKHTDKTKCISCMRCVIVCPHQARSVSRTMLSLVGVALKKPCSIRKEPELFL